MSHRGPSTLLPSLIDAVSDGVMVVDDAGAITHVNAHLIRMWNLPDEVLAPRSERRVLDHMATQGTSVQRLLALVDVSPPEVIELSNGSIIECRVCSYRSCDDAVGRIWTFADITERWAEEAENLRSRQLLALHVEQTPLAVIRWGLDFTVREWNPAAERIFGYPASDAIGRHASFIVPEHVRAQVQGVWEGLLAHRSGERSSNDNVTASGETIHCEWYNTPLVDATGAVVGVASLVEDITARRRLEREREVLLEREHEARVEAEELVRVRDDFIAVASHELRTPLSALKLQLELIPQILGPTPFAGKDRFEALVRRSLRQLERFVGLVNELLDISRAREETMVLERAGVNLSRLVASVLEQYRSEAESAGCVITANLVEAVYGQWDPIRLEQVIVNLLINAIKYGAGKPIEVETRSDAETAWLVVRDHGIGVMPEDRRRIFERFGRAVPVTHYRGLGLGLYITHQIVRAHGGRILLDSEPGRGSTFTVELPRRD
ncbi:MAG: PAS domain S-box protein [Kofleriaceae bacterium]|nr:PAS domain S-box protein [Kofleriaceae bacterium]